MTELTVMPRIRNPRRLSVMRTVMLLPMMALVLVLGLLTGTAQAQAQDPQRDYRGFFAGSVLDGSGWTACAAPITWSIDVSALRRKQRSGEVRRMARSLKQWAQATGLTMRFTGRERLRVDPVFHTLHPNNGDPLRERHIYISFIREGEDPLMVDPVAGLAMPARVNSDTGEVIGGVAMFRAKHARNTREVSGYALKGPYLHELGHVFALGHADQSANAMYPVVGDRKKLGPGDTKGARAMLKPCRV
ncbi:MAG: matrixin family metalloprotease [Candidatus Nanopelagicales bacterium]